MFCYQCEQTTKGIACTVSGVCGKKPDVAALQDLLICAVKGISSFAYRAGELDARSREIDVFVVEALFSTVTNVNFDAFRMKTFIEQAYVILQKAKDVYEKACKSKGVEPQNPKASDAWTPAQDISVLVKQGEEVSIEKRRKSIGADRAGLQELLIYGLKGAAAYTDHAHILGKDDDDIYMFFHEALHFLTKEDSQIDELLQYCLRCGEVNLKVMSLLDEANTGAYGNPVPTSVRVTPVKGKAIVVSGHDLKDLEELLKQTEGMGINIYTHGEMLPAHGYPELKKYSHLVGNYGGAWQDQQKEFDAFPGAIIMTTNCIQKPRESYKNRIFTCGLVAWEGVVHISDRNFAPVIDAALKSEGFVEDVPEKTILVGFGHNAVMSVAGKVIEAVKQGKIKHFFLIGGCDGAKPGRNYYTEFAESVPKDCIILTLACGKYRFNKLDFGNIEGIPRLLDVGQCNDAYSAIRIAVELAKAFNTDVDSLPLSLILSWYEQKAVVILLTLLYLGMKSIRLGPSLPAFITPEVLKILVERFNIMPTVSAKDDLKSILG